MHHKIVVILVTIGLVGAPAPNSLNSTNSQGSANNGVSSQGNGAIGSGFQGVNDNRESVSDVIRVFLRTHLPLLLRMLFGLNEPKTPSYEDYPTADGHFKRAQYYNGISEFFRNTGDYKTGKQYRDAARSHFELGKKMKTNESEMNMRPPLTEPPMHVRGQHGGNGKPGSQVVNPVQFKQMGSTTSATRTPSSKLSTGYPRVKTESRASRYLDDAIMAGLTLQPSLPFLG